MKNISSTIKFKEQHTPIFFLMVAIAGFSLLANRLGFYQDDWPYIFYAFNKGIPSLTQELYYDSRPNAAWLYILLFNLLGFKPILWHLVAMLFRWLTATSLWYFLKRIWPDRKREVTFAILLFLIHPFFLIQPYAVNSMLYWSGFLFLALSLLLMAISVSSIKYYTPIVITAVFLEALHLFTTEYFVGVVLIRPLILNWLLGKQYPNTSERIKKIILNWLPYLAALAAYIIWRFFLYVPPPIGDRNSPVLLYSLLASPLTTIWQLATTALQDSVIVIFTSWYRTLTPELFSFASIFSWFVLIISAAILTVTFNYLKWTLPSETQSNSRWLGSPLILGLVIVFLGMAPLWMIGQDIVTHKNQFAASRFGIGAIFGAALIFAVIIENLLDDIKKKYAVIAICVALAVAMHLTNEKDFSYSWEKQERFAQELLWRAPQIQPGTTLVTDEEILGYMGSYSVSFSIITSYQPGDIQKPPYWYFPFYYNNPNIQDYLTGTPLEDSKLTMDFQGNSNNMLLIYYKPELKQCLWILQPQDINLRLVDNDMRQLSAGSDINLINQVNGEDPSPPEEIYGKQNKKSWCYYFEKADLARQYDDWTRVVQLWNEAQKAGERPDNGFEYIPFIEGLGHTEDWAQVKSMTKFSNRITSGLKPSLCSAMDRLATGAPPSQQKDETINILREDLNCDN